MRIERSWHEPWLFFYPDFPILSTIPNLLHVFSVHLMNCFFSDFWSYHIAEKTIKKMFLFPKSCIYYWWAWKCHLHKFFQSYWTQISIPPLQVRGALSGGWGGMLKSVGVESSHWQVAKRLRSWASSEARPCQQSCRDGLRMSALLIGVYYFLLISQTKSTR